MSDSLVRVDMHLHTCVSFDSLNKPADVLATGRDKRIDWLVITDHNEIRGALELREMAPDRVLVGEEVKTREGFDVIGIFLETLIPRGTPARETCERIREQGGVVYLPHPFDGTRAASPALLESLLDLIDVVEVHNARCWPVSLNARARDWAIARGKLMGGGSDAHTLPEIGRGYVEMPEFAPERESFLASLAVGRVGGEATSPLYRLASNWAKIRKLMSLSTR